MSTVNPVAILSPFVEGVPAVQPNNAQRARMLAVLVAHFDRVMAAINLADLDGRFDLPVLDVADLSRVYHKKRHGFCPIRFMLPEKNAFYQQRCDAPSNSADITL